MTKTNTEAVEALANIMANMRQGQSDTPRCEPPSQQSIDWCADRIREVRKAEAELAVLSPATKTEPSAAGLFDTVEREAERIWDEAAGPDDYHRCEYQEVTERKRDALRIKALHNLRDHAALSVPTRERELLEACKLQLEYMDERSPSGTTPAIIARIDNLLNEGSDR